MREELDRIWKHLKRHEHKLKDINLEKTFSQLFKRQKRAERQSEELYGLHLALCVDTRDPLKQGRIKWFSPLLHIPNDAGSTATSGSVTTTIEELSWAWPVQCLPGFDDSGSNWIPPAGSMVCLLFQGGSSESAFWFGSTPFRDRGPENALNFNFDIPEYNAIWASHRKGYMVGKNDESQVHLPNNTSQYAGYDIDGNFDVDLVPDAFTKTTYPHIYSFKTPDKHNFVMDDGDPKCNRRWKRIEIQSSMGAYFLMKDDLYHPCGDWTNPQCQVSFTEVVPVVCSVSFISYINPDYPSITSLIPVAYPCMQGPENCPTSWSPSTTLDQQYLGTEYLCVSNPYPSATSIPVNCSGILNSLPSNFSFSFNNTGNNKYHKHMQECFPFYGSRGALNQSGIQLLARSGATLILDDSVEFPRERLEWERCLKPFDYDGCTGVFKGRTVLGSATEHYIELNDQETNPGLRGANNGINLVTACGNSISLNDETLEGCVAGEHRGIHIKSTADHSLDFVDNANQQCSPTRQGGGNPGPWSQKAFVRLRSGYGLQITLNDSSSQTVTDAQYLQVLAPQKDNLVRGPHVLHMQEKPVGAGQVFLRAGGDFVTYSYDDSVSVVGSDANPSNKLEFVSNMKVENIKNVYYNKAKTHVFYADDHIFLLAGQDCGPNQPCIYPVVVATTPIPEFVSQMTGMRASEHVFASSVQAPPLCSEI